MRTSRRGEFLGWLETLTMPFPTRIVRSGLAAVAVLVALSLAAWQMINSASAPSFSDRPPLSATPGLPWFENVVEASGITFRHYDCATSMRYIHVECPALTAAGS
jgi:hypothetical protein